MHRFCNVCSPILFPVSLLSSSDPSLLVALLFLRLPCIGKVAKFNFNVFFCSLRASVKGLADRFVCPYLPSLGYRQSELSSGIFVLEQFLDLGNCHYQPSDFHWLSFSRQLPIISNGLSQDKYWHLWNVRKSVQFTSHCFAWQPLLCQEEASVY